MILFGTGGIRGVMQRGEFDNETVMVASKGVSNYMKDKGLSRVVIAYDTRNNSRKFAELAAMVFAADGHKTLIFKEPVPTPVLSYAVRYLKFDIGVVITASHNPPEYNGYKVYTSNGVQAIPEITDILRKFIENVKRDNIKLEDSFSYVEDVVLESYIDKVCEILDEDLNGVDVVYTPLHGTGAIPVVAALRKLGANVITVEEQMFPDGNFPTVSTPNPEEDEALNFVRKYMKKHNVKLGIATDPDCDRVGVVWKDSRLTGNQVGVLLTDLLSRKVSENPMIVKTIVSTDMVKPLCKERNITLFETPTGFKFIGDLIENKKDFNFLFGFEESCGYLAGDHARDKDGVIGTLLIALAAKKFDLLDRLEDLYKRYGYYMEKLLSFKFKDLTTPKKIYKELKLGKLPQGAQNTVDYSKGIDNILPNETLRLDFDEGKIYVRPSGTEPKLKAYIMVNGDTKNRAHEFLSRLSNSFSSFIESII
ncbi:phospho-sugar mutase [Thermosipho ferrireducens]|uniref:Phospho-sugar mutase n=1 Tax=Thermosipho ferrireducens TaxID=2571116 RepID=A0ABX7S5V1_9BACT|nr:phospho-sugar mutase [Thermosipho ferrireducens]QTA37942.1 phospho-sugar mutase [Thermosipho ferrireducens]